jgi:hypothetical protein
MQDYLKLVAIRVIPEFKQINVVCIFAISYR